MGLMNLLFKRRGVKTSGALSDFYSGELAEWRDIYNGGGSWRYARKGGLNGGGMRKVASLGAARAVCAELARLCFAESSELTCADKETEEYLRDVLEKNSFSERFSEFVERVFALGGGVVKVYYDNGVKLDFITADRFVPTKWDAGGIYAGAFGSAVYANGKNYILAETQELTDEGLVIENRLYRENGAEEKLSEVYQGLNERTVIAGLERPLFVYFRAGTGSVKQCGVLGASVFAGAEDTLKSLDVVFDSLSREFVLGKKRIIVPSYAVRGDYDENGELRRYFDVNDEVFEAFSTSDTDDLKIADNTGELRVTEHIDALGELLDLLCMQVGLSEGALSFKNGTIRTAAEVVSRNSRTYRTTSFYRRLIAKNLAAVAKNVCLLGKMAGELSRGASEDVMFHFADGVCEDDGAKTERARMLYSSGLISRARAVSEIYGVSIDKARAMEREDFDGNKNDG